MPEGEFTQANMRTMRASNHEKMLDEKIIGGPQRTSMPRTRKNKKLK
jgi:hypothetical protein